MGCISELVIENIYCDVARILAAVSWMARLGVDVSI